MPYFSMFDYGKRILWSAAACRRFLVSEDSFGILRKRRQAAALHGLSSDPQEPALNQAIHPENAHNESAHNESRAAGKKTLRRCQQIGFTTTFGVRRQSEAATPLSRFAKHETGLHKIGLRRGAKAASPPRRTAALQDACFDENHSLAVNTLDELQRLFIYAALTPCMLFLVLPILASHASAATSPTAPRVCYMNQSGLLKSEVFSGGNARDEYNPGVGERWKVIDFDVRADGGKAIVSACQYKLPDENGSSAREKIITLLLDMDTHTTESLELPGISLYKSFPFRRWSPDGRLIGFINEFEVFVYDVEDRSMRQASHLFVSDKSPPSGSRWNSVVGDFVWMGNKRIAAWNGRLSGSGLAYVSVVNLESGAQTTVSSNGCSNPTPAPDGRIAWINRADPHTIQTCAVDAEGVAAAPVDIRGTEGAESSEPFAWSPDGLFLAFGTGSTLKIIDTETGQPVSEIPNANRPVWFAHQLLAQTPEGIVNVDLSRKTSTLMIPNASLPEKGNCLRWD